MLKNTAKYRLAFKPLFAVSIRAVLQANRSGFASVGYDFQSSLLISDVTGSPIAPIAQSITT